MIAAPLRSRLLGFTLIEILVAVSIFALIGIASARMLASVASTDAVMNERAERLFQLQRGMAVLDRDLSQLIVRPVRDQFGDPQPPLIGNGDGGFEFTRSGWSNPLGESRSNLQRVSYSFDGERLQRSYWTVLDRAEDSEPLQQIMFEDVTAFSVAFVDAEGNRSASWPRDRVPLPGEPPPAAGEGEQLMPVALEVTLGVAPFGEFSRLWTLPREHVPLDAGQDEQQVDDDTDDADADADTEDDQGGRGAGDAGEDS